MTLNVSNIDSLKLLPCFDEIIDIAELTGGLSHRCFKVTASVQKFFVKKLNAETAKKEVFCSINSTKQGLSPSVIYHDDNWLVTEFIEGSCLTDIQLSDDEKQLATLSLMAQLHKASTSKLSSTNQYHLPCLDITSTISSLLADCASLTAPRRLILEDICHIVVESINSHKTLLDASDVFCHGDINYSNILKGGDDKLLLIDFECAQLAPIEFDVAMYIAVNNIPNELIGDVIVNYEKLAIGRSINRSLLDNYILSSYLINALWYFTRLTDLTLQPLQQSKLQLLANQQAVAFDKLSTQQMNELPKLFPIISSNV